MVPRVTPTLEVLRDAPLHRVPREHAIVAALGVVLVALSWLLIERASHRVPSWERSLFVRINELPDGLRYVLWPVMQLGNFWIWAIAAPILFAVYRRPAPAVTVAVACVLAWLVAKPVKSFVGRGRPIDVLTHATVRESGIHGLGFVSGHSAVAAAFAAGLSPWLPRPLIVVAWVMVAGVGIARMFFGAHLPLDVAGGVGVGLICGAVASAIVGVPST
jgi:glycosyltransferase 2 family protein